LVKLVARALAGHNTRKGVRMNSLARSIAVAAATFGASVVGMLLQWIVPAQFLTDGKGTVGAMVGLVTLLLALVLGLLVFTAFSVYTTQQAEAQSLGPVIIELDVILEEYGPEVTRGRMGLREALGRSRKRFFGDVKRAPQAQTLEETRATMHWMNTYFDGLQPSTERQRQLLTSAKDLAKNFAQTQMLMARQLANPFPPYVLVVVICWACALFLGNGLVATPNPVSVGAHLAGAIAIGSAIFLILELSSPYTGLIRLSPAGLDRLLQVLGKADAKAAA
jgi:ABC-type multidrug transport system fused ATPase/permease subunit